MSSKIAFETMTELNFAIERIPQNLQALGLLLPALSCCLAQFTRKGGINYFITSNYFKNTGNNLLEFLRKQFTAHDHEIKGIKPKKNEYVVSIPNGDKVDSLLVNRDGLIIITDDIRCSKRN